MHSDNTTENALEACAFLEIPHQGEMGGGIQPMTAVGWNKYGLFLVDRRGVFDKDSDIRTDEVVNLMRKAIEKILEKVEYDFD
jgi:hypothetical protein